jgi:hypothetical protein
VDLVSGDARLIICFCAEDEPHEYFRINDKKNEATRDITHEVMASGEV